MVQSLSLYLTGVQVVRTGGFKNLLKVVFGWSGALFEIALGYCHELLIGVLNLPLDETMRATLLPLLPTLSALFGASNSDIGGCSSATPASTKVMVAPIACSPEACQVAMLSNSLVVFGCSQLSL
jgi:hypothetical protein